MDPGTWTNSLPHVVVFIVFGTLALIADVRTKGHYWSTAFVVVATLVEAGRLAGSDEASSLNPDIAAGIVLVCGVVVARATFLNSTFAARLVLTLFALCWTGIPWMQRAADGIRAEHLKSELTKDMSEAANLAAPRSICAASAIKLINSSFDDWIAVGWNSNRISKEVVDGVEKCMQAWTTKSDASNRARLLSPGTSKCVNLASQAAGCIRPFDSWRGLGPGLPTDATDDKPEYDPDAPAYRPGGVGNSDSDYQREEFDDDDLEYVYNGTEDDWYRNNDCSGDCYDMDNDGLTWDDVDSDGDGFYESNP